MLPEIFCAYSSIYLHILYFLKHRWSQIISDGIRSYLHLSWHFYNCLCLENSEHPSKQISLSSAFSVHTSMTNTLHLQDRQLLGEGGLGPWLQGNTFLSPLSSVLSISPASSLILVKPLRKSYYLPYIWAFYSCTANSTQCFHCPQPPDTVTPMSRSILVVQVSCKSSFSSTPHLECGQMQRFINNISMAT